MCGRNVIARLRIAGSLGVSARLAPVPARIELPQVRASSAAAAATAALDGPVRATRRSAGIAAFVSHSDSASYPGNSGPVISIHVSRRSSFHRTPLTKVR
jgi:hypothetical protein